MLAIQQADAGIIAVMARPIGSGSAGHTLMYLARFESDWSISAIQSATRIPWLNASNCFEITYAVSAGDCKADETTHSACFSTPSRLAGRPYFVWQAAERGVNEQALAIARVAGKYSDCVQNLCSKTIYGQRGNGGLTEDRRLAAPLRGFSKEKPQ